MVLIVVVAIKGINNNKIYSVMSSLIISWICNAVLFVCCCIICRCFRKQVKLNGELLEKNKHDKQMWKEDYFDSEAAYERRRKELEMEYGEKLSALTNDAVTIRAFKEKLSLLVRSFGVRQGGDIELVRIGRVKDCYGDEMYDVSIEF